MDLVKTVLVILGAVLALASVLAALYFVFEAACRHYGWWPDLFNIDPNQGRSP